MIRAAFICLFILNACASHQVPTARSKDSLYLKSALAPKILMEKTEDFLQWQKGYNLSLEDDLRGLLVTEWTNESPLERHQWTFRVQVDAEGSLLTAHLMTQRRAGTGWITEPSMGDREASLLQELRTHLELAQTRLQ